MSHLEKTNSIRKIRKREKVKQILSELIPEAIEEIDFNEKIPVQQARIFDDRSPIRKRSQFRAREMSFSQMTAKNIGNKIDKIAFNPAFMNQLL